MKKKYYTNTEKGITICKISIRLDNFLDSIERKIKRFDRNNPKSHCYINPSYTIYRYLREAAYNRYRECLRGCDKNPLDSYDGDVTITFTGQAVCAPEDTFDKTTGKDLAEARAMKLMKQAKLRLLCDASYALNQMTTDLITLIREKMSDNLTNEIKDLVDQCNKLTK